MWNFFHVFHLLVSSWSRIWYLGYDSRIYHPDPVFPRARVEFRDVENVFIHLPGSQSIYLHGGDESTVDEGQQEHQGVEGNAIHRVGLVQGVLRPQQLFHLMYSKVNTEFPLYLVEDFI